jgi:hypothetical protein
MKMDSPTVVEALTTGVGWRQDPTYVGGTLHYHILDGKRIAYHSHTEFLVQVGKGRKGAYKTRYRITGDLKKAVFYYACLNIGLGHKKRLMMPACTHDPILAQASS